MDHSKKTIELITAVTIGPKGQVVIPAEVREKMSVGPGDKLFALYLPDRKAVGFIPEAQMQQFVEHMGTHLDSLRAKIDTTQ